MAETAPDKRPLLNFAHNGVVFHAKVRARIDYIALSMNKLCREARIAFSTSDRWRTGSKPDVDTIREVEKIIKKHEIAYSHKLLQHREAEAESSFVDIL